LKYYEIKDESWEEIIKYYFSEKSKTNKNHFINEIYVKENICIKNNEIEYLKYDEKILPDDIKIFFDNNIPKENICEIYLLENEWNNKITFFESNNFFILRIWETYA
jgi:hypothetical protein